MLIEQAILTKLLTTPGLIPLVGQKIYYVHAPQNVIQPYIVFSKISAPREHSHNGSSHLAITRFQFSIFASTYLKVKQIAGQIQDSLQAFSGIVDEVNINAIFYQNEIDFWDNDVKLYHTDCEYLIAHNE